MVRIVSFASTLLVAGGLVVGSIGVAGVAAAAPTCSGAVPTPSSHTPFTNGPASSSNCEDADDTGKTSMVKIASAGTYTKGGFTMTATPQKTA